MFGWGKKEKTAVKEPDQKEKKGEKTIQIEKDTKAFKVKVTSRQPCQVLLHVQVPVTDVNKANETAFLDIQSKAKVSGFRPGKAPLEVIKKNYVGTAWEQAVNALLRESVVKALEQEKIDPITTPIIEKIDCDLNKPLHFDMKVECAPDIRLKEYKKISLKKKTKTISEEDVNKKFDELRESHAKLIVSKDDIVANHHFIVVDYEGSIDGAPLKMGKAENQLIDMSASQSIPELTEGLRGAKTGETKEIPVTFPKDHPNKELSGKTVSFRVTVSSVKEKELPQADDEFAKDVGCENMADLKDKIRNNLQIEFDRSVKQDMQNQVISDLLEKNTFDVPVSLVNERREFLNHQLKHYLMQHGATEESWKESEEKMSDKNKPEAERQVRLSYILSKIADEEKLVVEDMELDEMIRESVESAESGRRDEMKKMLNERREHLRAQMKEEKIFNLLLDNAKTTEVKEG